MTKEEIIKMLEWLDRPNITLIECGHSDLVAESYLKDVERLGLATNDGSADVSKRHNPYDASIDRRKPKENKLPKRSNSPYNCGGC